MFVINTAGDCVASSNHAQSDKLMGFNYSDRKYFQSAMNGRPYTQYAIGRATGIAGLFFSTPISVDGHIVGVVAIKINVSRMQQWLDNINAFITDANGVIILSHDPAIKFKAVDMARIAAMPETTRQAIYLRSTFQPLHLEPTGNPSVPDEIRIDGQDTPYLVRSRPHPDDGLVIYNLLRLDGIEAIITDARVAGVLIFVGGVSATLLLVCAGYVVRSRQHLTELDNAHTNLKKRFEDGTRHIRELLEFNQKIVSESNLGIAAYHSGGPCVLANDAIVRIVGAESSAQLLMQNFRTLPSWKASGLYELALAALRQGCAQTLETHFKTTFGTPVWLNVHLVPFVKDNEGHLLLIASDIRQFREAEQAQKEARAVAEEASRAKSDFVAVMSHEIRTPMNAVIGMLGLMARTPLNEQQADYLSKMRMAASNLLGIINDILDYSKIEAGRLELEAAPFRLTSVLEQVESVSTDVGRTKAIELVFVLPHDVHNDLIGDSLRLVQVLLNLTNNALKFTERGEVVVTVEPVAVADEWAELRFSVRDTGIGMSPDQIARLFTPFTQADSSMSRKYGGSGLGLTISRQIVELMGGTISIESETGKGTTCSFTIRFGRSASPAADLAAPPGAFRACRALVVDDLEIARLSLQEALSRFDIRFTAVCSGAEALAELIRAEKEGEEHYTLVFLDWKMPGLDGIETAHLIRNNPTLKSTPLLIMVSAYDRDQVLRESRQLDLEGILVKPVTLSRLHDTILSALHLNGMAPRPLVDDGNLAFAIPRMEGLRVLLIEDNPTNQQIARELLELAGIAVTVANDGQEGVALLMAPDQRFDVVLMDLHMPVMDGFQATRLIRAEARNQTLPIIAMTADAMAQDRQSCLDAGMNDHIAKPINVDQLFATLRRWTRGAESEPAAQAAAMAHRPCAPSGDVVQALPGIDVELATRRLGGQTQIFLRALKNFLARNGGDGALLSRALAADDTDSLRRIAHDLKGAAANLGAVRLSVAAAELEAAVRTAEPQRYAPLQQDVVRCLKEVTDGIAKAVEAQAAQPPGETGGKDATAPDALAPAIHALSGQLRINDPDAIETLERRVSPLLRELIDREALERLEANVQNLTFVQALQELERLCTHLGISL